MFSDALSAWLDDKVMAKFATLDAKNTAFAALSTAQKRGTLFWVDGLGAFLQRSADSAVRLMTGDMETQSDVYGGTTEPTGLMLIPFPKPFDSGRTPVVTCSHATTDTGAPPLTVRPYIKAGYTTKDNFHVSVKNADGSIAGKVYLDVSWIAHGPSKPLT
ncbi:hypothetical protein FDO65_10145 [Nakamurella flava]|uniref:H-type lectin domain-containing protein n=1 Tax=Nakamurella flava TaxID=2576308 RepID=A0A4V6CSK7_9ACTN|nr:hypothetical protein [Nakamurella flava]TKV61875.1 hypothetical protein FDO65_10145 [Nakamurella flava]